MVKKTNKHFPPQTMNGFIYPFFSSCVNEWISMDMYEKGGERIWVTFDFDWIQDIYRLKGLHEAKLSLNPFSLNKNVRLTTIMMYQNLQYVTKFRYCICYICKIRFQINDLKNQYVHMNLFQDEKYTYFMFSLVICNYIFCHFPIH